LTVEYRRGFLFEYPVIREIKKVYEIEQKVYQAGLQGKQAKEIQNKRNETVQKEKIYAGDLMTFEQDTEVNSSRGIAINNLEREITRLSEQQVQLEKNQQQLSTLLGKLEFISQENVKTQYQTKQSSEIISTLLCPFKGNPEPKPVEPKYFPVKEFKLSTKPYVEEASGKQDPSGNSLRIFFSKAVVKFSELKKKINIANPLDEIRVALEKLEMDFENLTEALPSNISSHDFTSIFKSLEAISQEDLQEILENEKFKRLPSYLSVIKLTAQQCKLISTSCKQLVAQNVAVLIEILSNVLPKFRECLCYETKIIYDEKIAEKTQVLILQAESLIKIPDLVLLNQTKCALYIC
jgi:hypothetical protein